METVDSIPISDKTSDEIMSDVEHGKSMMGFSDSHILSRYRLILVLISLLSPFP